MYPARQAWFATCTQMSNEPSYVDGGEKPGMTGGIYYHYGLDIGGAEGLVDVVAATDGLVVSVGTERLPGYDGTPVAPRLRRGLSARRSRLVLSLQPSAHDRHQREARRAA